MDPIYAHELPEPLMDIFPPAARDRFERSKPVAKPSEQVAEFLAKILPSDEEATFLEAIHADPNDANVRLVYADWLDEHDSPIRAAAMRAQAEAILGPKPAHNADPLREWETHRFSCVRCYRFAQIFRLGGRDPSQMSAHLCTQGQPLFRALLLPSS